MRWLKDPLVFFLVAGAVIFALAEFAGSDEEHYTIVVRPADVQRITDQWAMQMRRPPSELELSGLVEQFVREEIYYREAQRMGLDTNDTIVRRRMVQKLTFLTEDNATAAPMEDEQLQAFYAEHIEDYALPARYTFRHRYFSADRREDAQADAQAALNDAQAGGDPFMLQREYAQRSEREIGDLFGRSFAQSLAQLTPAAQWQGPLQSAYGWHLVMLNEVQPPRTQAYAEVRERVLIDAQQAARQRANTEFYEALRARYIIHYPDTDGNESDAT